MPRTCTPPSGGCCAAVEPGPDDLFIAADPHQRIYNNRVSLASLRINVRGRSHRLSLNYRTTQEILDWAVPLLGTEPVTRLDSEVDSLAGYRSPMRGTPPQLRVAATRPEEFGWPAERIGSWLALGIEPQAFVRRPTRKSSSQAPASPHAVSEPEPLPRDRDIAPRSPRMSPPPSPGNRQGPPRPPRAWSARRKGSGCAKTHGGRCW